MEYYLGGDVSKGYCDFIILDKNKSVVEEGFQLDDTQENHLKLYNILKELLNKEPKSKIYAAFESTGGYENNWVKSIQTFQYTLNVQVARLNPYGVSHSSKANMERIITDQISARNVAEYLVNYQNKVKFIEEDDYYSSLRKQWKYISLLKKQKVQYYCQLESIIYSSFPEILTYCKKGMPNWVLELLAKYPTSKKASRARVETLSKIPYITKSKAEEIITKAKNSVASSTDSATELMIQSIVEQIIRLEKLIKKQKKLLIGSVSNQRSPEVKLLTSFKGIAEYSAIGLLIEIGFIERFATCKKLASYFGLHPVFKKSGDGTYAMRMSKKGRSEPRNILYNVALTAIRDNKRIREIYVRHLRKGISKMAALGAIMHKILRMVYGMLKNNEVYNPDKDRKNAEVKTELKIKKIDKTRRFQDFDSKAPISNRQTKKRAKIKEELELNVPK
ncbi:MAG: IS110 family transposase [Ignavibacteriae bacterium]|nr:IS110 family transposase [Ignavibacteriota bacterium]NOH00428.1 IS110 family transposase [Ignavibacteriota bacterium]